MWLEQGMLGEVVSQQSIDSKTVGEVTPVAVSGIAQFCSPSFPSRVILSEPQYPESQLPWWCRGLSEGLSWWHVTLARMDICAWTIGTALLTTKKELIVEAGPQLLLSCCHDPELDREWSGQEKRRGAV